MGDKIQELEDYTSNKTKSESKEVLKGKIKEHVKCNIDELNYEDDPGKIKKVLLLFNIVTLLLNSNANARFQFERYKTENWDIEHIHSVQTLIPEAANHRIDWLNEVNRFTKNTELKTKINDYLKIRHGTDIVT